MKFYFDANISRHIARAFNHLEVQQRLNKVFSTADEFAPEMKDPELYPLLAKEGGILITKDKKMRTRPHELEAIKRFNLYVVVIELPKNTRYWGEVAFLVKHWLSIKEKIKNTSEPGFVYCSTKEIKFVSHSTA